MATRARRRRVPVPRAPHPDAHEYKADPLLRGCCVRCPLPRGNAIHDPDAVAARAAMAAAATRRVAVAQAEHQRRAGEGS